MKKLDMAFYAAQRIQTDAGFRENVRLCEESMKVLIARYRLAGKNILSIGAGDAFEEYWLHRAGCTLTLVDLNPDVAGVSAAPEGRDRYFTADALEFVRACRENFDVLYVSSLHPDEIRREETQAEFIARANPDTRALYGTWPPGTAPYHDMIVEAFRLVKRGGLIILQHYRGGVCVIASPFYLGEIATQFKARGAMLIEAHTFRKSTSHLHVVASKCGEWGAAFLRWRLTRRPALTSFHGRYPYRDVITDVIKCYPAIPFRWGNVLQRLPAWSYLKWGQQVVRRLKTYIRPSK